MKNMRILNNIFLPLLKFSARNMQYTVVYLSIVNAYNCLPTRTGNWWFMELNSANKAGFLK